MRRGFIGMMLKSRCNRRSGWGKGLLDQKKTRMSRSKIKFFFFIGKALSIMNLYHVGQMVNKQLYQEVLARLRDSVRKNRPELWENRLGCCTMTVRRVTRLSSSAVIWPNIRHPLCPTHPILRT